MCVLLFYYFLYFKVNLALEKTNQLGESSPKIISALVNLDPIILEKRWIYGESWPNDFVEKVDRGEDLRWVGSRCPLTHALKVACWQLEALTRLVLAASSWQKGITDALIICQLCSYVCVGGQHVLSKFVLQSKFVVFMCVTVCDFIWATQTICCW